MENSIELLVQECLNKRGLRSSVSGFQFSFELVCLMVQRRSYTVNKEIKGKITGSYPDLKYAHLCRCIRYALEVSGIDMTVREFLASVYQDVRRELYS